MNCVHNTFIIVNIIIASEILALNLLADLNYHCGLRKVEILSSVVESFVKIADVLVKLTANVHLGIYNFK